MKPKVDYDSIAATYNLRFGEHDLPEIARALVGLALELNPQRLLEVGCGTGRWLESLAEALPGTGRIYGADLSAGMLAKAAARFCPIHLTRCDAGWLPFKNRSFDMLYCMNALHHFSDPRQFIREARRLLAPGGVLSILGRSSTTQKSDWYVYEYFQSTYELDEMRFPHSSQLQPWMEEVGFTGINLVPVVNNESSIAGRALLADHFIQKNSCSQLALLSDDAYQAGLTRIQAEIQAAEEDGETLPFTTNLRIDMLSGWVKPESTST